jgi:hypothetical protein
VAASGSEGGSAETKHLSIVRRFENYEVMLDEEGKPIELGRGAMGITYKAFDVDLRIPVTLKLISEKYVANEPGSQTAISKARGRTPVSCLLCPVTSTDALPEPFQRRTRFCGKGWTYADVIR